MAFDSDPGIEIDLSKDVFIRGQLKVDEGYASTHVIAGIYLVDNETTKCQESLCFEIKENGNREPN
jgi:hypothetical protein